MHVPNEPEKAVPIQAIPQFTVPIVWHSFVSLFVLNWLCELVKKGVRSGFDQNFRKVHLQRVYNNVLEFTGKVSPQLWFTNYNHLRKWESRWFS
jgi:hypothetical protein